MAGSLSDYAETKILDHLLGNTTWAQEEHLYVGLSTATIADDSTGGGCGETTGDAYARVEMDSWDATAGSRVTENTNVVTFVEAGSGQAWGTITDWFIADADTTGNIIAYGTFEQEKNVQEGDDASIAAGGIDIEVVTGGMSNFCASEILDHVFKTGEYTQPAALYVGLSTGSIADGTSGDVCAEVTGDGYERKQCDTWNAASATISDTENDAAITFAKATGSWGTVIDFFISPDASAGDILFYATADASKVVGTNDTVQFDAETLTVSLD